MKSYMVCNLLTGETWNLQAISPEQAVYVVVLTFLGRNYADFTEQYGRWTFSMVSKVDDRETYSVVR